MSWCACDEWEPNIKLVNAPNAFLFARNPTTYKGYEGEPFRFCPWCGDLLIRIRNNDPNLVRERIVATSKRKYYTVELKAVIKRRGRMQYLTEVSIPARSLEHAAKLRRPFVNAIIWACKHRKR
jgi:hypothetical protein